MTSLYELEREYDELLELAKKALAEAGEDIDFSKVTVFGDGTVEAKVGKFREINDRLDKLAKEIKELRDASDAVRARLRAPIDVPKTETKTAPRGIGEALVSLDEYKAFVGRGAKGLVTLEVPFDVKALFSTVEFPPESVRTGTIAEAARRPIELLDLIPTSATSQAAVPYMEELVTTNAAAETAEGSIYPEGSLDFNEVVEPVRKISVWLPVTDEVLRDNDRMRSLLDNRLTYFLRERLDRQVLVGNGTAPNLNGILNRVGVQQVTGATPANLLDKILNALTLARKVAFVNADAIVISIEAWEAIVGAKDANGVYLFGNPAQSPTTTLWGRPLVPVSTLPTSPNTVYALVGAFRGYTELVLRQGVEIEAGYINDDFVRGRQAVRASLRAALAVYRPSAFVMVHSGV
jgi:HK97 family phage major capsid protein